MKILNIAHRGASGLKPENTKSAFLEALKYNIDAIELDIHLTKDKKIVIIHDSKIDRTSNGKGRVKDYTINELKRFDFSYKFKKFKEKILTLEEFFKIFKGKNIQFLIEIKEKDFNVDLLLNLIKKYKMQEKVILSSFHYSILEKIRIKDNKINLNYIIVKSKKNTIQKAKRINCRIIAPLFVFLRKKFIEECHENNILVYPWVLNKEFLIKKFIKLKVDAIVSNYPNKVKKVLKELNIK